MRTLRFPFLAVVLATIVALVVAACGGGEEPTPAPTQAPARPAPTATPTPVPTPSFPEPGVVRGGRRGGVLQVRAIFNPQSWDSLNPRGSVDFHVMGPMMNNLLWPDIYTKGNPLVGDTAERWDFSADGKTLTFKLRPGIKWHDGAPFTSKDVKYNIDRAYQGASGATNLKPILGAITGAEAVDDLTVKVTLSKPSNVVLQALGSSPFYLMPGHLPFPENVEKYQKAPIGTGPFKISKINGQIGLEYVRNEGYFRPGLPYLDGVNLTVMGVDIAVASFRAGKLDGANLDDSIIDQVDPAVLKREHNFTRIRVANGLNRLGLNQRGILANPKVREALDLAMDRKVFVDVWLKGWGVPYAAPLLPPEMGGAWGLTFDQMKTRPGYRDDKTADLARAKQLLAEAGVNPADVEMNIITSDRIASAFGELTESMVRGLGFKTKLEVVPQGALTERLLRGQFDIYTATVGQHFDDPLEPNLVSWVVTGGPANYGKWSDPDLDKLFADQDATLDPTARRALLNQLQETILRDRFILPLNWREGHVGYMPWLKNYPPNPRFTFSGIYKWEQVWLER